MVTILPRPEDPRELTVLIERLSRFVRGLQHAYGLKPAQWSALRYLARANSRSRSPAVLADFLGSSRGTVSQTLIALERKNLISRRPDSRDGRATTLVVTDAGRRLAAEDPLAELEAALARLPQSTQASLAEALAALLKELRRHDGHRQFGACAPCRHFRRGALARAMGGADCCGITGEAIQGSQADLLCREFDPRGG